MERDSPAPDPLAWGSAREVLAAGCHELGLELEPTQIEKLLGLADLLETWSRRQNLTAHRTPTAIVHRLVLDAAALSMAIPLEPSRIVDLGSGAGFPGLPLAILRSDARVTLVESRERRVHFQRAAIRQLDIANAVALRGRSDELMPEPGDLVIAQALAAPEDALPLLVSWCVPGGLLAIPGSLDPPSPGPHPAVTPIGVETYRVPCAGPHRTLWLGRRIA